MKRRWLAGLILALASIAGAQTTVVTSGGGSSSGGGAAAVCTSAVGTDAYACAALTTGTCPANFAAAANVPVFMTTDVANTGASTFDLCSLGAKAIVKNSPTASVATVTGDMVAATSYLLQYNATGDNFKLISIPASVMLTNQANTLTSTLNITAGQPINFANLGLIYPLTGTTPDSPALVTTSTSESWQMKQLGDIAFDFQNGPCGTSGCTDPTIIQFSNVQDAAQYNASAVWGAAGGAIKTLTESSATALIRIPVAQGAGTGGSLRYSVWATDTTDHQLREGEIKFAVVNKAGTETCTVSAASEAADGSVIAASTGTLTYAITCATASADTVDISLNAVSSLAQTTLQAWYSVKLVGPGQPARQ